MSSYVSAKRQAKLLRAESSIAVVRVKYKNKMLANQLQSTKVRLNKIMVINEGLMRENQELRMELACRETHPKKRRVSQEGGGVRFQSEHEVYNFSQDEVGSQDDRTGESQELPYLEEKTNPLNAAMMDELESDSDDDDDDDLTDQMVMRRESVWPGTAVPRSKINEKDNIDCGIQENNDDEIENQGNEEQINDQESENWEEVLEEENIPENSNKIHDPIEQAMNENEQYMALETIPEETESESEETSPSEQIKNMSILDDESSSRIQFNEESSSRDNKTVKDILQFSDDECILACRVVEDKSAEDNIVENESVEEKSVDNKIAAESFEKVSDSQKENTENLQNLANQEIDVERENYELNQDDSVNDLENNKENIEEISSGENTEMYIPGTPREENTSLQNTSSKNTSTQNTSSQNTSSQNTSLQEICQNSNTNKNYSPLTTKTTAKTKTYPKRTQNSENPITITPEKPKQSKISKKSSNKSPPLTQETLRLIAENGLNTPPPRSRRNRTNVNYAEPSLGAKLRNEKEVKSKPKKKTSEKNPTKSKTATKSTKSSKNKNKKTELPDTDSTTIDESCKFKQEA